MYDQQRRQRRLGLHDICGGQVASDIPVTGYGTSTVVKAPSVYGHCGCERSPDLPALYLHKHVIVTIKWQTADRTAQINVGSNVTITRVPKSPHNIRKPMPCE